MREFNHDHIMKTNNKQMKKIFVFLIILFGWYHSGTGQNPLVVNFSSSSPTGQTATVDVTVQNFTNIIGLQLFVGWDEDVLTFSSITNINNGLPGFNSSSFAIPPTIPDGHVNLSWFSTDPLGNASNLPNNAVLFSIVLNVVGAPCSTTDFNLVTYGTYSSEYYNGNYQTFQPTSNKGTVSIPGTDCNGGDPGDGEGVGICPDAVIGAPGSNVCVPIRVDSFQNITSAQFGTEYDASILEYTGYQNGPLSDVLVNPTGGNKIRFLWIVPGNQGPQTIPDGGIIVKYCFNVIGDLGEVSPINIVDIIPPPSLIIEFIDGSGNELPHYTCTTGKVTVGNPVEDPVRFIAEETTGDINTNVCVDITTENFDEIGGFQWAMTWNNSILNFTGLGPVNNIGISANDINLVANNKLRVTWLPTAPVTKPDGTVLFQLCYNTVGSCGSSSNLEFTADGTNFPILAGDANGNPLPVQTDNGSVTVTCSCDAQVEVVNASCFGAKNGSIYVTLTGCTAKSFLWNTGQTTQNLIGVGAGTYAVTITDVNNKTTIRTGIIVTEPADIVITETLTQVTCATTGSIQLNVTGGTPPYSYTWTPNVGTGPAVNNLPAGSYSVIVTDSKSCLKTKTFTITSNIPAFTADAVLIDITCKDANNGKITVVTSGGCSPYSIAWSDGQAQGVFNRQNLAAGSYTATITDSKGTSATITRNVTNPAFPLQVTGVVTQPTAVGGTGQIALTVSGGQSPYSYLWNNPGASTTKDLTAVAGKYIVEVTDARNCKAYSSEFEIKDPEIIVDVVLDIIANTDLYGGFGVSCDGACDGKIKINRIVANGTYTIYLDNVIITEAALLARGFCAGTYTIRLLDSKNKEITKTVTFTAPPKIVVQLTEVNCAEDNDGSIEVAASGGTGNLNYNWGIGGQLGNVLEGLSAGTYGVTVTDANKCTASLTNLEVEDCPLPGDCFIGMPVITANNDGINDKFTISCLKQYTNNKLDLYDRWGKRVYEVVNYSGDWDGSGNDGLLPEGSYMWVLTVYLGDGSEKISRGTVTLLR